MRRDGKPLYEFGSFRLDGVNRSLSQGEVPVLLTPKAFDMLLLLVENAGRLLDKDELMKRLWPDTIVEEGNLTQNIFVLRRALGESPDGQRYIETIPKRGYRFVAGVKEIWEEEDTLVVAEQTRYRAVIDEDVVVPEIAPEGSGIEAIRGPETADRGSKGARLAIFSSRSFIFGIVLLVGLMAALYYWEISSRTKQPEIEARVRSIAVLPFKPLSADGSDEYLGLGMADTLITKLSNVRQLIVRPTSATLKYTNPQQDPVAAGREQQVEAVLEGSIQRSGEKVRVTVRLLSVGDGRPLWAYQCNEQQCTDLFAVQDAISEQVTEALIVKLSGEDRKRLTKRYTENIEAYQLYLKGRYFWNKRTEEGLKKGIEYFNQSLGKDSKYALAYAGLAECYGQLSYYGGSPPKEASLKAEAAATKALELDETLAEAHTALAVVRHHYDFDWSGAEREYQRAIELDPHYASAHHRYGNFLVNLGQFDRALAELKRAQDLDPLSLVINKTAGDPYYFGRHYDRAIEQFRQTLEMDKNFYLAHMFLGMAYEQQGRFLEALAEFQTARQLNDIPRVVAAIGHAYALLGQRDRAEQTLDELNRLAAHRYVSPYDIATIHTALGDVNRAITWLQRANEDRAEWLVWMGVDPRLDRLRSDVRFQDLLRRVGLPH